MNTTTPVPHHRTSTTPSAVVPVDRDLLVPAVVHLGVGGLRNAHHTLLLHEVARTRTSTDWGLVHVELRLPQDRTVLDLDEVGGHGVHRPGPSRTAREIDVLLDLVTSAEDSEAVVETLAAPTTKLVTLQAGDGEPPCEALPLPQDQTSPGAALAHGYLVRALARRRVAGLPPFTVLSCDPLPRNGCLTRRHVLDLAGAVDPDLAVWIAEEGRFPGSLVDDLLPGTGDLPFQWFVEDDFGDGRPPVDRVGARLVPSTAPYEQLRMRLFHGARCALAVLARSTGATTSDQALTDPRLVAFLGGFLTEAAATLLHVPGVDLARYRARVLDRLADPRTGEPLRPSQDRGAEALSAFVLPSLRTALDHRTPRRHLVLAVAAWCRSLGGPGSAAELLAERRAVFGTLADHCHLADELQEALDLLAAGALDPVRTTPTVPTPTAPLTQEVHP